VTQPPGPFEYLSPEWIDAVRVLVERLAAGADLAGVDYTVSEELTDPPADLAGPITGTVGWYLRVRDGEIVIGDHPVDDADLRVIADYRTHRELSRRAWGGDSHAMAASRELRLKAEADGRLRTDGDLELAPVVLRDLVLRVHDRVAAITA
jgi:hypothetical protein